MSIFLKKWKEKFICQNEMKIAFDEEIDGKNVFYRKKN